MRSHRNTVRDKPQQIAQKQENKQSKMKGKKTDKTFVQNKTNEANHDLPKKQVTLIIEKKAVLKYPGE
jgi:hypothetical protein